MGRWHPKHNVKVRQRRRWSWQRRSHPEAAVVLITSWVVLASWVVSWVVSLVLALASAPALVGCGLVIGAAVVGARDQWAMPRNLKEVQGKRCPRVRGGIRPTPQGGLGGAAPRPQKSAPRSRRSLRWREHERLGCS